MIISLSDFNNLSEKDKKKTLENLKRDVGVNGIIKEWNISRSKAYSMMREFDISVNTKPSRPSKTKMSNKTNRDKNNEGVNVEVNDKNNNIAAASDPQGHDSLGTSGKTTSSVSTVIPSQNGLSKFHLYVETQGSASMISETLNTLLTSGRLTDTNLQINITLQEI